MLLQQQQAALLAASAAGENFNLRISTREEVDAALANLPSDDDDANDFGDDELYSMTRKQRPRGAGGGYNASAPPRRASGRKDGGGRAYFAPIAYT